MAKTPEQRKKERLERIKKFQRMVAAERIHREQREKAYKSKGGYLKVKRGEGINEDWVSRIGEMRNRIKRSRVSMRQRASKYFRDR